MSEAFLPFIPDRTSWSQLQLTATERLAIMVMSFVCRYRPYK